MALIQVSGLERSFRLNSGVFGRSRTLQAVAGIDLTLEKGEALGIVGESGSGKSTLAKMLLGLLPPTAGTITLRGKPLSEIGRRTLADTIQPVFQDPYSSLNPRRTLASIVAFPLSVKGVGTAASRQKTAIEMLERVGLASRYGDVYPNELSGGQRQRVAIARALVLQPEIVLLDEPTSALDVSVQAQILNLLVDLRRDLNLTYIFISHNLAVVEHMTTRVGVMYLGRMVEIGPSEQVFAAPTHPYTKALLDSLLTPDPSLDIPSLDIGLAFPNPLEPPSGCAFHPRCPFLEGRCKDSRPSLAGSGEHLVACHLRQGGVARPL